MTSCCASSPPAREAYEHFLSTQILQLAAVRSVNTSFVLRTKKSTTRLPVL